MKRKINYYHQEDSLLVISSFPLPKKAKARKQNFSAIAWHSEKTLLYLAQKRPIIVAAEKLARTAETYQQGNILIKRVWQKEKPFSLLSIIPLALSLPKIKNVFVPFEFNAFGGLVPNLLLLIVLLILKILGKKVTVEVHQVIMDVSLLVKHVNIKNPLLQVFFNISLKIYYFLIGQIANTVIVFENELKQRLIKIIPVQKIRVLSLAVEPKKTISQQEARKKLSLPTNKLIIMAFGYLNGYKGLDWLLNSFAQYKKTDVCLLIAGGQNPYLKKEAHYQAFYQSILKKVKANPHVIYTNFIPDEQVKYYFSAVDLVILPYEVFLSASGPFSLALSYHKAMILSSVLKNYTKSDDFKRVLQEVGIKKESLFCPLLTTKFLQLICKLKAQKKELNKLKRFSENLAKQRDIKRVILAYEKIFFFNDNQIKNDNPFWSSLLARFFLNRRFNFNLK